MSGSGVLPVGMELGVGLSIRNSACRSPRGLAWVVCQRGVVNASRGCVGPACSVLRCASPGSACPWCWGELCEREGLGPDHGGAVGVPVEAARASVGVCPGECVRGTWTASVEVSDVYIPHLVPARLGGTWHTRMQAAPRPSAALAGWGAPCPSGTALASQALLGPAEAFVSPCALPRHSFRF